MQTLDRRTTPPTQSSVSGLSSQPVHRLIVLIPSLETDPALTARRVWELANAAGADIQFISLSSDAAHEPAWRRHLVLVSAMVQDGGPFADIAVIPGTDWVRAVESYWKSGDMVVCFAEHRVGPLNRPISQLLQSTLDAPLYILSGVDPGSEARPGWFVQVAMWIGFLGIILGFFLLQTYIDRLSAGAAQTILLLISVCVEAWTVWKWNSRFG